MSHDVQADVHRVKVLHVAHGTPPGRPVGDPLRYVHRLAQVQNAMGYDTLIATATPALAPIDAALAGAVQVDEVEFHTIATGALRPPYVADAPDALAALGALIAREAPDVVHVHSLIGWGPEVIAAAQSSGAACVVSVLDYAGLCLRGDLCASGHTLCAGPSDARCASCIGEDLQPMALHQRTISALSAADLLLVSGPRIRTLLEAQGVSAHVMIQRTGSDTAHDLWRSLGQERRDGARQTLARSAGAARFILAGTQSRQAGTLRALEAIAEVAGAELILAGPAQDEAAEAEIMSALSRASDRASWVQPGDAEAWRAAYARADAALVLPEWEDPAPQALLHARGAGLPIITTDLGAAPAYVHDGEDAIVIMSGSTQALIGAMERMSDDRVLLPSMARAVHSPHPMSAHAADLVAAYQAARRHRRGAVPAAQAA